MQIPTKIQHGEKVIGTIFEKINGIIDYLNASKLRKSSGIDVRETPSGTVLELVQKSASAPQAQPNPAAASGLEATVSADGTATVAISGSTALVIKPGINIQISGGTNGELIISAAGGGGATGFPDLITGSKVSGGTNYPVLSDSWLIGDVGLYAGSGSYPTHLSGYVDLKVSVTETPSSSNTIELYCNQGLYEVAHSGLNEWYPVCIPIKAGYTIRLMVSGSAFMNLYLFST